ncbi:MAG: hydroxymethylglutaryl-CoA reductase, degradative [Anaerolineales bacterium]|nr:hydroxymethylglutaryl-CoA reductase, degradative [Anaerolineales bacterium]
MTSDYSSSLSGLYNLPIEQRMAMVSKSADLDTTTVATLQGIDGLTLQLADHMIENVVGVFGLPLGIATNFLINGRDVLVPMVVEEPSVVAGASFMAKLARANGGFEAKTTEPEMIGQIQVLDIPDLETARLQLLEHKAEALEIANSVDPIILRLGGGARDIEVRILESTPVGPMLVIHLVYDTRDAMGANTLNTAAERLTPWVEEMTTGRAHLRILSNLADRRLALARCTIPSASLAFEDFDGQRVRDGIIEAWAFAAADPYRAATHNKGIMNGVDAVLIATGNDWRAVEAGAHAYAAREGHYTSLSRWWSDEKGNLRGELEMPMAVGTVGGATRVHPAAKACLRLMRIDNARSLAEVIVSVGLAQNLAALRALATEGIQRGHMTLHARQVAIAAGAQGELVARVAHQLVSEDAVHLERAQELVQEWESEN